MNAGQLVEALKAVHPTTEILLEAEPTSILEIRAVDMVDLPPEDESTPGARVMVISSCPPIPIGNEPLRSV